MIEWFRCKKCKQIFYNDDNEIIVTNKCPFCGNNDLSKVVLKSRDVSPTYIYHHIPLEDFDWTLYYKEEK